MKWMKCLALLMISVLLMAIAAPSVSENRQADTDEEMLREAIRLGIADEDILLRKNEPVMEKDIPAMVQAVFRHGYGKESAFLKQMETLAEPDRQASRYWFAMAVFYSYCETYYNVEISDTVTFMNEMDERPHEGTFGQFDSENFGVIHNNKANFNPDWDGLIRGGAVWELCCDAETLLEGGEGMEWRHDFGNWWVAQVPFSLYDRVTGEKVLGMDENQFWNPARKMTVGDAVQAAVRYWRFFEDPAEKVAYDSVGGYDRSVITDDLLNKPTSLPANSCAHLPAEWHGQTINKWSYVALGATARNPDRIMREDEMEILKGAGFNHLKFNVSFSYLQAPEVTPGYLNETRLKELDKLLALCMEYDIHLCLLGLEKPDHTEDEPFNMVYAESPTNQEEIEAFAAVWGAIARRYAAIPNEYLSFDLHCEPPLDSDEEYVRIYKPAVDAIRAESPERTIIADIHSITKDGKCMGAGMAGLGVALAYHLYDPRVFCVLDELEDMELQNNPEYLHSVIWPYTDDQGRTFTGEMLLDFPLSDSSPEATTVNRVRAIAEEYGVGFIVNEFGVFGSYQFGGFSRYRYTDETLYAYLEDIISTLRKEGIGWVYGNFNEIWSYAPVYPAVEGVEYEKVGYYYVDRKMQAFFRTMCEGILPSFQSGFKEP